MPVTIPTEGAALCLAGFVAWGILDKLGLRPFVSRPRPCTCWDCRFPRRDPTQAEMTRSHRTDLERR